MAGKEMKRTRLTPRIIRALWSAIVITHDLPRGGDLPDYEHMKPDDPTDEDFEAALAWVRAQMDRCRESRKDDRWLSYPPREEGHDDAIE